MTLAAGTKEVTKSAVLARQMVNPKDYGIDLYKEAFAGAAVEDFNNFIRGAMTLDEMLLRPRTARHFCDTTR